MKRMTVFVAACLGVMPLLGYVVHANLTADDELLAAQTAAPAGQTVDAATIPGAEEMANLAKTDPVAFLEACLDRYRREVKGYTAIFHKHERIGGSLNKPEEIDLFFRENPHSVLMLWRKGARLAERSLYVEGENNNKILVRPNGGIRRLAAGDIVEREVNGPDARQSGRYTLDQFGIRKSSERVLSAWKAAKDKGALKVAYKGIEKVPMTGNRSCYHLHRVCAAPENDGVVEHTLYVDTETCLPIGSRVTGKNGELIGEYFFRDLKLNPAYPSDQFKRDALIPK
jgi:hypothetical protein